MIVWSYYSILKVKVKSGNAKRGTNASIYAVMDTDFFIVFF